VLFPSDHRRFTLLVVKTCDSMYIPKPGPSSLRVMAMSSLRHGTNHTRYTPFPSLCNLTSACFAVLTVLLPQARKV
jgi:hypothetical protein